MSKEQSATPDGLETHSHCPDHAECTYPECCGMDECANCAAILAERTRGAKALADARAEAEALRVALRATRYHAWHAGCRGYLGDVFFARIDAALAPVLAEGPQHPSGVVPAAGQAEEPLGECFGHLGPPRNTGTPHPKGETCFSWGPLSAAWQPGPSGNRNEEEGRNG